MSLNQALASAMAGLRVNQANLSLVASNVANAETPGYTRKTPVQVTTAGGANSVGVRLVGVDRQLDLYVQRALRVELAGFSYADLRATIYQRLQSIYGVPGSASSLTGVYDSFTSSLQALSTSPDSASTRTAVIGAAQVLVQQLNSMSGQIQSMRSDAEHGLSDAVGRANNAMDRIAAINRQLAASSGSDLTAATLKDDRDRYVDELSRLMDIVVMPTDRGQITIFTNSGIQLVGMEASTIAFDARGAVGAQSQWSADPDERSVGTLTISGPSGGSIDLIASRSIRSGEIAAYLEMRDRVLVEAQAQLDELAAAMARALSDRTVDGTAVSVGAQDGFDIDVADLAAGNSVRVTYTDTLTNTTQTLTLIRVDDPSVLPLPNDATSDPDDRVVGIDFSGGLGSIVTQVNAALGGSGLQASNPSGTTLRLLDDGNGNQVVLNAVAATITQTSLTGGTPELPLFVDGAAAFTGAIGPGGPQSLGFAGRIAINPALLADPSRLVVYSLSPPTEAGDATRANFILDRLTNASHTFSPGSGIGSSGAPFVGTISSFARQIISHQGEAAASAERLRDGQQVVLNSLQQRFSDETSVNVDVEMANLLNLQNAYAANARVLATVKEMLDSLMRL